jgi:hypothetical protein
VLKKMKKVFVFHTRAGLGALLGEQGDKTAAGRGTLEGEALLTCLIHESYRFANKHLQE